MRREATFRCGACGASFPKWAGQCPKCGAWNSLGESAAPKKGAPLASLLSGIAEKEEARLGTGFSELDRVLGGGVFPGAVILVGGDPGIGKSTLLLQALARLSQQVPTLYVTGEESLAQVASRAKRLGLADAPLRALAETRLEAILHAFEIERPKVAVVDSIQVLESEEGGAAGSVSQVRESAGRLTQHAKAHGYALFIVGHVTKEGSLAGPKILEHLVDTVLYFEGEPHGHHRLLRAFKNRFGAVNELGVFLMAEMGLKEVTNPSAIFLTESHTPAPGRAVLVTIEGSRPLALEIQALVDESPLPQPRRLAVGMDPQRLLLGLAVLHRHAGVSFFSHDVFVAAVGGLKVMEPAADLAALLALYSSLSCRPLPPKTVIFGEVGLTGELRPAPRGQDRLKEAAKLGFEQALIPAHNAPKRPPLEVFPASTLVEAISWVREKRAE